LPAAPTRSLMGRSIAAVSERCPATRQARRLMGRLAFFVVVERLAQKVSLLRRVGGIGHWTSFGFGTLFALQSPRLRRRRPDTLGSALKLCCSAGLG
jgi:hypothetical protein